MSTDTDSQSGDYFSEHRPDFGVDADIRLGVHVVRLAIDNGKRGAVRLCDHREGRSGIDLQRGAEHEKQVALTRSGFGTAHRFDGHRLTEGDCRCLDDTAAYSAGW